jgi:hypothetical protein
MAKRTRKALAVAESLLDVKNTPAEAMTPEQAEEVDIGEEIPLATMTTMTTTRTPIETAEQAALAMVEQVRSLTVTDAQSADDAGGAIKELKRRRELWLSVVGPFVDEAYGAWKKQVAKRDAVAKPLDEAERELKGKLGGYMAECERQRRAAEAAAQAEAQRQAEAERAAEVKVLEDAGDAESAAVVASEPVVAPVIVAPPIAKPAGLSTMEVWKYKVVDERAVPRQYLQLNEGMILKIVKAMKGQTQIPGIQAYPETTVRSR